MNRNEFLRKAIRTFIEPATVYDVSPSEGKHILEALVGVYIPKPEFIRLMLEEGFEFGTKTPNTHTFRAKYKCDVAILLNHHWSREYICSHFSRRMYEKWDSINDAILVLKHMLVASHNRSGEDIETASRDILIHNQTADPTPPSL